MSTNAFARWLGTVALVAVFAACGGAPEPEPEPEPEPVVETESAEDIAAREAEEQRRREAEERRRMEAERERVRKVIAERVHFDFDKSDIRADAEPVLQRKVTALREHPGIVLQVEGHCDERGSNEYNLALGQRRAEAVRRYLQSYGIGADRLASISYGEERAIDAGHNEDAWQMNRRAEFVVTNMGALGTN